MYQKLKKYALDNGLTVEEKEGLIYGQLYGCFLTIWQYPASIVRHTITLGVKGSDAMSASAITDFLNSITPKYKYMTSASYNGSKITVEFQSSGSGRNYVPCMEELLKELTTYCHTYHLVPCCENCGTEYGLSLYQTDDYSYHQLCSFCYSDIVEQQNNAQLSDIKKDNVFAGIIGALLGSLAGVILWVVIYQLGYLSGLVGAVMIVCSLKGYEKFAGSLSRRGIIITCILSFVMILLAEQICLGIEIYAAYKNYYEITFFDAFRSVPSFLMEREVASAVAGDLIAGYLLMVFAGFSTIRQAFRHVSGANRKRMITTVTASDYYRENQ